MCWSAGQAGTRQQCQGAHSLILEKSSSYCLAGHVRGDANTSEALSKALTYEFMLSLGRSLLARVSGKDSRGESQPGSGVG